MNTRKLVVPLRLLSFVTTLCFTWSLILASTVHAAVDHPLLPMGHSRLLSMKEMTNIVGAVIIKGDGGGDTGGGGGSTFTNPAATPGASYPWIGSVGGVSTYTGNKTFSVPIVSWTQRGGLPVALTLTQNSESSRNGELGPKWVQSYDCSVILDASGNATVYWGNGSVCTFMKNVDGTFTPPPGIHDTFSSVPRGGRLGVPIYTLATKDQTYFGFNYVSATNANVCVLTSIKDNNLNKLSVGHIADSVLVQSISDATWTEPFG